MTPSHVLLHLIGTLTISFLCIASRWYILLVSFAIFPLTLTLSLGCKFVIVGINETARTEHQALGFFNAAVYDLESVGRDFLGCVDYSQYWKDQTNDIAFRLARFAGAFLLAFTTLATIINICLQCFSKHGKSWLWGAMRYSYLVAFLSQGVMYTVFASHTCKSLDGEASQCWLGRNGVAGVFNFLLLFGMVIATFHSFPPRNPVFQCWTGEYSGESSVDPCSDEDDVESAREVSSRHDGSVSLFATSKASSRHPSVSKSGSRLSFMSKKSKNSSASIVASQKLAQLSQRSAKSKKSASTKKSKSRDALIGQSIKENITEEEDKVTATEERDAPVDTDKPLEQSQIETKSKITASPANSFRASITKRLCGGTRSKKKVASPPNEDESFKHVSERVAKLETGLQLGGKTRAQTVQPHPISPYKIVNAVNVRAHADGKDGVGGSVVKAKRYPVDRDDSESIRFLHDLAAVTKLGKGGIRVKTIAKDHTVEIVDEYPANASVIFDASHRSDGAEVVKVRTEYYEQGSRTTKEVTHHDGSRTVVTTINSIPGNKSEDLDSISTKQTSDKNTQAAIEGQKTGQDEALSLRSGSC
jgi:hypothetical protein